MHESIQRVTDLVRKEVEALGDPSKVFIGGFSVGLSVALGVWM